MNNTIGSAMPRLATRAPKQPATSCRRCIHLTLSQRTSHLRPTPTSTSLLQQEKKNQSPPSRCLHATARPLAAPKSKDRGPASKEDTQTDFNALNVLGNMPAPTTAIDACMDDGFALNNGMRVTGAGVLLVAGEAFKWRPWVREGGGKEGAAGDSNDDKGVASPGGKLRNKKGQFECDRMAWGALDVVWPKPDLLILGTGRGILPLSPETRRALTELGVRVEVQDTRNAAAQYNMLATERGLQQVGAALVPIGWREGE